jgi:hypothetical protein
MVDLIGRRTWESVKADLLKDFAFLGESSVEALSNELEKRRFEFAQVQPDPANAAKLTAQVYVQGLVIRFLAEYADRLEREKADLLEGNKRLNEMVDTKGKE